MCKSQRDNQLQGEKPSRLGSIAAMSGMASSTVCRRCRRSSRTRWRIGRSCRRHSCESATARSSERRTQKLNSTRRSALHTPKSAQMWRNPQPGQRTMRARTRVSAAVLSACVAARKRSSLRAISMPSVVHASTYAPKANASAGAADAIVATTGAEVVNIPEPNTGSAAAPAAASSPSPAAAPSVARCSRRASERPRSSSFGR
mmetsp:Transcript_72396/g.160876  ORF Transcript_72396/g.160876 Transcript_72396/m.160876 type:complete len:203 (+) Transcript_72396:155-763(+)